MNLTAIAEASPYFKELPLTSKPGCILTPDHEFSSAARLWIASRSAIAQSGARSARYIRKNTQESYSQYIRSLELFFAGHKMSEIRIGHLAAYQDARVNGSEPFIRYRRPQDAKDRVKDGELIPAKGRTSCPVKPKKVNQELGLLRLLMVRAKCWSEDLEDLYEPLLDDEAEVPRALSPEEQQRWLATSYSSARWNVVHWYSLLAFNTCMSTDEIRGLRLGDINLSQQILTVARKTSKNIHRARTIELVESQVLWAVDCLTRVASSCGAVDAQHYLFPWRVRVGLYDPTRSMSESGIKVAWNQVRSASGLEWFRQYDCRHTGITRLAEAGVPTDVIMAKAGHVSEKMRRHYTHISQASQRKWFEHSQRFHQIMPPPPTVNQTYIPSTGLAHKYA